jgi:hypothetical protein
MPGITTASAQGVYVVEDAVVCSFNSANQLGAATSLVERGSWSSEDVP